MSNLDKALDFISQYAQFGLSPSALKKTTVFYDLAHTAIEGGCIVELGSYLGFGTVPLWYGAQDGNRELVFAVDAYKPMSGWIGEPYIPDNEVTWHDNMQKAGCTPKLVIGDVHDLSGIWMHPISLLIHDLGSLNRMPQDVIDWEKHIIAGGTLAVRDVDDYRMGTEEAIRRLLATGRWGNRRDWPAFITSVDRVG